MGPLPSRRHLAAKLLPDQANERSGCSSDRSFEFFNLLLLKVAQAARHMQVVPHLVQRSPSRTQKLHRLPGVVPRSSFHDVRRHGQRRTTQLRRQAESLVGWKRFARQTMHTNEQVIRTLPRDK